MGIIESTIEKPVSIHLGKSMKCLLHSGVSAKPGLWTLDSGLDRGLDRGLDSGLHFGLDIGLNHSWPRRHTEDQAGPQQIQHTHTHDQLVQAQQLARSVPLPSSEQGSDIRRNNPVG